MSLPRPVYVEEVPTTRFLHPDTVELRKQISELDVGLIARYDFNEASPANKFAGKVKAARSDTLILDVKQRGNSVYVERQEA